MQKFQGIDGFASNPNTISNNHKKTETQVGKTTMPKK